MNILKKNPKISFYILSMFFSKVGNKLYTFALPLLVYELTKSSFQMGTMFLFETFPILVFSMVTGELIARFQLKKILFVTTILQIMFVSTFAFLLLIRINNIVIIQIIGALLASCGTIISVLDDSIIANNVKPEEIVNVNSYTEFLSNVAKIIGPVLAGILISYTSISITFIFDVITFIPVLISAAMLNISNDNIEKKSKSVFTNVGSGFIYIFKNNFLKYLLCFAVLINIFNGMVSALFVVYAKESLRINATKLSFVITSVSVMQLFFSYIAPNVTRKFRMGNILVISQILSGIGILVMGISKFWIVFALGSAINEGTTLIYNIIDKTFRQTTVPKNMLGRVNGVYRLLGLSTYPFAGFIAGIFAEYFGSKSIIISSGLGLVFTSVIAIFSVLYTAESAKLIEENISY